MTTIRTVIDSLVDWSRDHESLIYFSSAEKKQQATLGFRKRSDDNFLWESYPEGPNAFAKLCVFTRYWTYMTPAVSAHLRERFRVDLALAAPIQHGAVIGLRITLLAEPERRERLFAFLDWACHQEGHFGGR